MSSLDTRVVVLLNYLISASDILYFMKLGGMSYEAIVMISIGSNLIKHVQSKPPSPIVCIVGTSYQYNNSFATQSFHCL